ncbi:MAG: Cell-division-associated, ABC-transporter-like signaling protein FtsE, partial [uncultured Acidimicrobiales bacterium]
DQARERHQDLQERHRCPAGHLGRHRQGRVRLHGGVVRVGQVHLPEARHHGGAARGRPDLGGGQGPLHAHAVEDPVSPPQRGLHLPGLQAAPEQDGRRERRLRPRGHRAAEVGRAHAGAPDPRPRRPGQEVREPADRAVGRRAAAGLDRPRLCQPATDPAGRRTDREPRPHHDHRHHAPPRPHQPDRHHRGHGHPRPGHRRPDAPPGHRARSGHRDPRPGPRRLRLRRQRRPL